MKLGLVQDGRIMKLHLPYGKPIKGIPCSFTANTALETYKKFDLYPMYTQDIPEYNSDLEYVTGPRWIWDPDAEAILGNWDKYSYTLTELEDIKDKELAAYKQVAYQEMLDKLELGFTYGGHTYDCQRKNIEDWNLTVTLLDLTAATEVDVRTKDNQMVTLTKTEYMALSIEAGRTYENARREYWAKIDNFKV